MRVFIRMSREDGLLTLSHSDEADSLDIRSPGNTATVRRLLGEIHWQTEAGDRLTVWVAAS